MPAANQKMARIGKPEQPLCQKLEDSASVQKNPITKSRQAKFNFKKGNDLCAAGIKQLWNQKACIHFISFFFF